MTRTSSLVLPLQLAETFRICAPTVVQAAMGTLTRDTCDRRLQEWSDNAVRLAKIDLRVTGTEHVDRSTSYIVMSNHQSAYDIFTLMSAFPGSLRMIAKRAMFSLPVMGGAMRAAGFIELDRSSTKRAMAALDRAKEVMATGINVWIAPEGTRSDDGALLPFKKGGFHMAVQSGLTILPVTVDGTRNVLPAKDHRVRKGQTVQITFHAPVEPTQFGPKVSKALVANVRDTIASVLSTEPQK